jgi:lipopolysaccharide assembly protein A
MLGSAKRLLFILVLLLVGGVAFLLVLENSHPSSLVLLGWSTPSLPFSLLLILAFLFGMVVCLMINLWLLGRLRMRVVRQRREIIALRQQQP